MAIRGLCRCIPFFQGGEDPAGISGSAKAGAPQCVKESVAENVDGAPQCDEASSSSSRVIKKLLDEGEKVKVDLIDAEEGEKEKVDLEHLIEHIDLLLIRRAQAAKKKLPHKECWTWPDGSDWKSLNEMLSSGIDFLSDLKDYISGPVKAILKLIGNASLATAGLLVVAYSLERFDDISTNNEECFQVLKEMSNVANLVKILKENPKEMENEIEDVTTMIVKGAILCCGQMNSSPWKKFLKASENKEDLSDITQELLLLYTKIGARGGIRAANDIKRVLIAIERKSKSPLSREYPTDAVGIEKPIEEVLDRLECKSEMNAVTVILHGFGGMGKSTLADAVFSRIEGYKYSKVQLYESIGSVPDIKQLQKTIIEHLGPEESTPNFITYQDGQRELGKLLKKVQAFIYIDNVLDGDKLKELLPPDMDTANKVRFLFTARDEIVKLSCPTSRTEPKIYHMKSIEPLEAKLILEKQIHEGINESQFNDIIEICGGIPLMLRLAAPFIGLSPNKEDAYRKLKQQQGNLEHEQFKEMHCAFAYEALPDKYRDPLQDICSFFKGWDWETVADIVGENELEMLQSRALVTQTNGVARVHDVILTLSCQMSKKEESGKEVRRTFTSASKLKDFLQDPEETQGIKGIWLDDDDGDVLDISTSTLDSMSTSLRVLQLGDSRIKVEGKCTKRFGKLIFLKAKINSLPFPVPTKLPQLRYLSYEPNDLKLSTMPSSLTHVDFIGTSHPQAFQNFPRNFQQLRNLRVFKMTDFEEMKNLPESMSELQFLRKLEMNGCSSLSELPANLGSLTFLRELNLRGCSRLGTLPNSVEDLSSLTLLNLSSCLSLVSLPPGLGNLTRLVELDLNHCESLESVPDSISELKLLRTLGMSSCKILKELPHLGNLSFITNLSLRSCYDLEKLPDGFGQLANLRVLDLYWCWSLVKLPQGFGQLKSLEELVLTRCSALEELCDDFHCLSSLQSLDLRNCSSLEKLTEGFVGLASLQHLNLCFCSNIEGKWMDHIVKMKRLEIVHIKRSTHLVKRWQEIQRDGDRSWSCTVFSGQDLPIPEGQKENIEKKLLAQFDSLLTNGKGEPVHLSDLLRGTPILLICDANPDSGGTDSIPWPLIEEAMDEIQIIYIGPYFDELPAKVKDRIFVGRLRGTHVQGVLENMYLSLGEAEGDRDNFYYYFQILRKMVGDGQSDKYRPCWTPLTAREMDEFLLGKSRRYLRLKEIVENRQKSNIKLLRELFAPEADETTPVFQQNYPSQQDQTENSKPFTCGVDKLKGKTIIFELRHADSCSDFRLRLWKEVYVAVKEKLNLEIISVPIVTSTTGPDVYNKVLTEVPWLVLQKSWKVITKAVGFFLAKHYGWEGVGDDDAAASLYSSLIWLIEPNGRIMNYEQIRNYEPGMVKTHLNSFRSVSYQAVKWRIKGWPYMHEEIEELRKGEWKQLKNMSMLEFLFIYLKNVSDQVKRLMLQGKMICLYRGEDDEEDTCSIWTATEDFRDDIHIIPLGQCEMKKCLSLTDALYNHYYYSFQKTIETEETPLSYLSGDEAAGFWMRLLHLKEEINNEIDNSDKQFCELKTFLHSFQLEETSMTFMDKDGKLIAACKGWIFNDGKRAKRLIKKMMKDLEGGKETRDEDSSVSDSLTNNMQTAIAAVKQENVDVDLDSLSEYILELFTAKELHQLLKFNKGKKWSRPKVVWPTSRGFCMLKNFLLEGTSVNWVKNVLIRHPEEENWLTVTRILLKELEEPHWAAAALLVVADLLERLQTVSDMPDHYLGVLDQMFKVTQYIKEFNQRAGRLWRGIQGEATGTLLSVSIVLCAELDPCKFDMFLQRPDLYWERLELFSEMCDTMTDAIGEDPAYLIDRWKWHSFIGDVEGESENEGSSSSGDESGP